jgi:DMSO reductase family type II enzyme chaperone
VEAHVRGIQQRPGNLEEEAVTVATITIEEQGAEIVAGARSAVYGQLVRSFSFPTDSFCRDLVSGDWTDALSRATRHLPYDIETNELVALPSATAGALQSGYVSTIEVGTGKPYCPLYEGSHRSGRMKLMEDLVRFYEHFGLKIEAGDHPDHLCAELEFMHYLTFKEAAIQARSEPVADIRRAQRDFLERHLCRWLPRVRSRLESAPDLPSFYPAVARLAEEFCRKDFAWLKAA